MISESAVNIRTGEIKFQILRSSQCDWSRMSGEIFRRIKVEMNPTFSALKYFPSNSSQNQTNQKVHTLNNMLLANSP